MVHAGRTTAAPRRPLALLLLAALPAACAPSSEEEGAEAEPAAGARRAEPTRVVAAPVERREMVRYLETTTRIESENEIAIHPEVAGIVTALGAEEGDAVRAGDVLCELDRVDAELDVREAEVALEEAREGELQPELDRREAEARVESTRLAWEQARRDHERDQRLFESSEVASPVSRQALEASKLAMQTARSDHEQAQIALEKAELAARRAKTAVRRAEVALDRARAALAKRTITAPFDGQIATRSVRLGQSVGPADALFVLTDTENIRAVFYRAQEELGIFQGAGTGAPGNGDGGEPLTFRARTEALPGTEFTGRVVRVSPTIDRESGQFRVTGALDPPPPGGPRLLPGMLVRLRIATDRHPDALVVPKRAVRRDGDAVYVLRVAAGDVVERVPVREGYGSDEAIEVVPLAEDALAAGDRVVTIGSRELEDGDPVAVEGDDAPADADVAEAPADEPSQG